MNPEALERIQRLEDIEAIKKLKARYCYLADEAYGNPSKWKELVDCFVEDAWLDFGDHGIYKGKEEVRRFFEEVTHSFLSYAAHMVSNPIVEVTGDRATGSWYFDCPATDRRSGTALWVQGRYEDGFVKVDGEWKWKSITARFDFISPFDEGWARTRMFNP